MKESSSNGCDRGDHVYYQHQDGTLKVGEVHAVGKDGFIVKGDGQKHRVMHKNYVGHKSRKEQTARIVDQGEDGALATLGDGRAVFLHGYPHALEEGAEPVRKALLFFKAGPIKNRPGLILRQGTDKSGKKNAHWVRTDKGQPKGDAHKAKVGEHVAWKGEGGEKLHGKVVDRGRGGSRVETVSGKIIEAKREHLKAGHKFDPTIHPGSKMSDEEINNLHEHLGAPTGRAHQNPDVVKDQDSAYKSAEEADSQFKKIMAGDGGIAEKIGAKVFVDDGDGAQESLREHPNRPIVVIARLKHASVKGHERAKFKASKHDLGWAGLRDLVRGSVVVPNLDAVPNVLRAIKDAGIKVSEVKNRFKKPAGTYRDILMNMELPNGHVGELQVHIAPMIRAKEGFGGHAHFEVERNLIERDPPNTMTEQEEKDLKHSRAHQADLYGQAWKAARR